LKDYVVAALRAKLKGAGKTDSKPWVKHFGSLAHLRKETRRSERIIEEEFETIDPGLEMILDTNALSALIDGDPAIDDVIRDFESLKLNSISLGEYRFGFCNHATEQNTRTNFHN
jgi:hypothetical protein